jgi:hypothetical protein
MALLLRLAIVRWRKSLLDSRKVAADTRLVLQRLTYKGIVGFLTMVEALAVIAPVETGLGIISKVLEYSRAIRNRRGDLAHLQCLAESVQQNLKAVLSKLQQEFVRTAETIATVEHHLRTCHVEPNSLVARLLSLQDKPAAFSYSSKSAKDALKVIRFHWTIRASRKSNSH